MAEATLGVERMNASEMPMMKTVLPPRGSGLFFSGVFPCRLSAVLMSGSLVTAGLAVITIRPTSSAEPAAANLADSLRADGWQSVFDGKTLGQWKSTAFGGEGEVKVADGVIRIGMGADLSGITWQGPFPRDHYEISLEARRVDGLDFFCGLTFPVGKEPCSLILGGWGGGVVGLSSIDGADASENSTSQWIDFEQGRWYAVRVCVSGERIRCFLDGKQIIDEARDGREFSVRPEVILSAPLGIASYATTAELREIRYRRLDP